MSTTMIKVLVAGAIMVLLICGAGCGKPAPDKSSPPHLPESMKFAPDAVTSATMSVITRTANVPPGSTYEFVYKGRKSILINYKGQFRAYVSAAGVDYRRRQGR